MTPHTRLKQGVTIQFNSDIQKLVEENEKYRQAYTSLRSCQHIAGVQAPDLLAGKIKTLIEESDMLHRLLNTNDKAELLKTVEVFRKQKEFPED
jgi:hypothetical protein